MDRSREKPESQTINVRPVGVIRNHSKDPSWGEVLSKLDWKDRAARMDEQRGSVSEIVIDGSLEGILDGIEEFSHIIVLYWAHLAPEKRRSTTRVHPMGNKDFPLVGVFATRSPVRPNSILMSVVRLIGRKGNNLMVTGLDALDGSPVLDIKPYHTDEEIREARTPDWMKEVHARFTGEHKK